MHYLAQALLLVMAGAPGSDMPAIKFSCQTFPAFTRNQTAGPVGPGGRVPRPGHAQIKVWDYRTGSAQ